MKIGTGTFACNKSAFSVVVRIAWLISKRQQNDLDQLQFALDEIIVVPLVQNAVYFV